MKAIQRMSFMQAFLRERRAGDLVFAVLFLLLAVFLLTQLGDETKWVKRTKFFAQPAFWPTVSLIGMAFFAALHYLGAVVSPKRPGRMAEVKLWLRSLEFAGWFLVYVWLVPVAGYLPVTMVFCAALTWRLGYRAPRWYLLAACFGAAVVVLFKGFLSVKIPGALLYEYFPDALRNFFILNL